MRTWRKAVFAGVLALLVEVGLRFGIGTPWLPELMAGQLVTMMPMNLFAWLIETLGFAAKWIALGGMIILFLLLAGGAGVMASRRRAGGRPGRKRGGRPAHPSGDGSGDWSEHPSERPAIGIAAAYAALHLLLGVASGVLPWQSVPPGDLPLVVATLMGTTVYTLAFSGLSRAGREVGDGREDFGERGTVTRRQVLRQMAWGLGLVAVGAGRAAALAKEKATAALTSLLEIAERNGLVPYFIPNDAFYKVSKNFFDPHVSADDWRLGVEGLVETPFTLRYEELIELPAVEQVNTLSCISNPIGGGLIGNARWKGVPLRNLLERAGLGEGVVDIALESHDGYTESIPLDKALDAQTLLAWEMNGEQLPWDHGFPARLVVPDIYGMKNAKWLTVIRPVDHDYTGFWQHRGWSDVARTKTLSRIDTPRAGRSLPAEESVIVAGIAFAGARGIRRVEVSTDGGAAWQPAALEQPLSHMSWVRWALEWAPAAPGRYELVVRATDGDGILQEEEPSSTLPDGASGLHRARVRRT